MKLKLLSMLAGASLFASSASADTITYSFLNQESVYFAMRGATVTAPTTVTPTFCLTAASCSTVSFNPTSAYDQVTLKNGSSYFFAANAFTTPGYYTSISMPGAAAATAQFSTQIIRAVSAAPEPAAWTLMIAGIGLAGYALRGSRRTVKATGARLAA